ncbi:MAG: hypothetical protein AB1750_11310 [Chloroflexota bacterium]
MAPMKIIDKTPFQDEKGQISFLNRIQGMLKYGLSWPANLEAQKKAMAVFNKTLEKGYTLVRNQRLGASEIIVPLVLIGPAGMYLIEVTPLKGFYRARGDEWGTISGESFQPAPINILKRTEQLGKVLQKYYDKQGVKLAAPIEAVLLAADPGMHIESVRPVARVVMSDAIERFAASLLAARPVYNSPTVNELVERLTEPRSAAKPEAESEQPDKNDPFAIRDETPFPGMEAEPSRMQSILNAPKSDALIDTGRDEIGFAFDEADAASSKEPTVMVKRPSEGGEYAPPTSNRPALILGMTVFQLAILGFMLLLWCFIMFAGVYFLILPSL